MKRNKVGIWIALALTVIALIAGVVLTLVNTGAPVKVGEEITASYSRGYIYFHGTIVNESDEDVEITYLDIVVPTNGDTLEAYFDKTIVIGAGGSYSLDDLGTSFSYRPTKVSRVTVEINGFTYNIQGGLGIPTTALFAYIFAIIFGIATISLFISDRKKQKAYANIEKNMPSFGENAVTFGGFYSKEGETGKAAAKSVVSVLGGFLSAFFLGFGAYKIYSSGTAVELVVSDDGLFVLNNGNVTSLMKGNFPETEITVKKKQVIMKNVYSKEYFVFNTTKKGMTPAQLEEKLKTLIAAAPAVAAAPAQEAAASPFNEFEQAPAATEAAAADGVAENAPAENDKNDPFGNL